MTAAITDFNQFTTLRSAAENNDPAVLREVAGQFEALFLQTMMKNMREASLAEPLFGQSDSFEMFQEMQDKQLALEMSSGRGIGLAEMIVRQLGGETRAPGSSAGVSVEHRPARVEAARRPPEAPSTQPEQRSQKPKWTDASEFARDVWPHVKRVAGALNVAPVAILAQAALETGWGKHVMPNREGGNSLNLFGIKAGRSWSGDSVTKSTIEFDNGVAGRQSARFRSYPDLQKTFDDYADFIGNNPRYAGVPGTGDDLSGFANALQASGYATDPRYAKKITEIAESPFMKKILSGLKKSVTQSITQQLVPASQPTNL